VCLGVFFRKSLKAAGRQRVQRKTTLEWVELTPLQYPEKIQKSKLIEICIAFEEHLLFYVGKEACPE